VRPSFTREPGARPRLSGLGRDCPRTRHPDDVSIRPRSQSGKRLPESPDPHRIGFDTDTACARSFRHRSIAMGRRCIAISLGRSLPPALDCTLKQSDSRGNDRFGRAYPLPSRSYIRRTGLSSSTVVGPDQRDFNERNAEDDAFSLTSHGSDNAT
jgi:hypothetical protein